MSLPTPTHPSLPSSRTHPRCNSGQSTSVWGSGKEGREANCGEVVGAGGARWSRCGSPALNRCTGHMTAPPPRQLRGWVPIGCRTGCQAKSRLRESPRRLPVSGNAGRAPPPWENGGIGDDGGGSVGLEDLTGRLWVWEPDSWCPVRGLSLPGHTEPSSCCGQVSL